MPLPEILWQRDSGNVCPEASQEPRDMSNRRASKVRGTQRRSRMPLPRVQLWLSRDIGRLARM